MNDRQTADIATALATINAMREEIVRLSEENGQLKADLNARDNRIALLDEERTTWRTDATILRAKLVELATIQSNVGLLLRSADSVVAASHSTLSAGPVEDRILDAVGRQIGRDTTLPPNRWPTDSEQLENPLETLSAMASPNADERNVVAATRNDQI